MYQTLIFGQDVAKSKDARRVRESAYGTLRNETKRNGTLRNGTLRNGTLRNGTLRNGTFRNGYNTMLHHTLSRVPRIPLKAEDL